MSRYRRPVFLGILIISLLYFSMPSILIENKAWIERYQMGDKQSQSNSVVNSLVYLVKPEKWVSFNIPEGTQQLKIISNAHIQSPDNITEEDNWTYSLRYQLVNHEDEVILDKLYHQRCRLTSYRNEQGKRFFGNFYSGYNLIPLDGRLLKLSIPEIQQAKSVRISFIKESFEVEEAAVRLYVPSKVSNNEPSALWLRMNNKDKESLAKHSVYPAALLSEVEKINLLKHRWQPLGPTGIGDKDYVSRTLYILKEIEQDRQGELLIAAGLQLDPDHPGIIPIPENGGELEIKITQLDGKALLQPVSLQLNWFGRGRQQRWQRQAIWLPENDQLSYNVQGGLFQIKSSVPIIVHANLKIADQQQIDITPKPLIVTTFLANKGLDYQMVQLNDKSTALRIDVRQIYKPNTSNLPETVKYQWFDQDQQLIESGSLSLTATPSIYDRLTGKHKDLKVSDPVSYFLNVPNDVNRLRLTSERDDLIVNTYNQPYQFRKFQQVPENSYVSLDKTNWSPSWFLLRPLNRQDLVKQQGLIKVAIQYRPPQDEPAFLTQQYLWEDYLPQQKTEARFILTKMDSNDYRDEALSSVYCQLKPNQSNKVNLKTYGNLANISPEIIYMAMNKPQVTQSNY